ncbi:hypothetical protein FRX31_004918 [Thalictrum thalictroides]|uniref:Replication factor A C-terminal domain-containing protein n=1 Tax=Thalictrum thalictroides TaxID=46969 RepID=A0A7J6X9M8_THATH|nr:hypothetical protein FRX31_004918 [Thalictrum thalictroides]
MAQAIVSRISIRDTSGTCIVSLFGNKAAAMLDIQVQELLEYEQLGVNLSDIFEQARENEYIFEVKMSTYQDNMSLSITRSKLTHSIPDDDDSLNGEDGADITPSFEMVTVKKEKDDIEIPLDPQVVDDEDDEINLKLMRKRVTTYFIFKFIQIVPTASYVSIINFSFQVTQKNKRTETMKEGKKGSPAKKINSKEMEIS